MTIKLLLILKIIVYSMTISAAVYNNNETSEQIIYEPNPNFLSGFRNIIDKDFVIGGLFPIWDCSHSGLDDLEMVEAMLFAIDQINNDMSLLTNLTIGYDVRDSCNNEYIGRDEALDIASRYNSYRPTNISTPVLLGIVGPAYTAVTSSVASLLSRDFIQIPHISYASSDVALEDKDLYKYLLRTIPSDNLQTDAMVDLVSYFRWQHVNVIVSDIGSEKSVSDAFVDIAMKHGICIDKKIDISFSLKANETIAKAVQNLLKSKATVVVLFIDAYTAFALFKELSKTNSTGKFVWITGDEWTRYLQIFQDKFPITRGILTFQLNNDHVKEFDDYFSQLTSSTNIRNPFFHDPKYNYIYHHIYCAYNYNHSEYEGSGNGYNGSGSGYSGFGNESESSGSGYVPIFHKYFDCPDDLTAELGYSQREAVPFVIDAVYAFAHALQNFLDNNCAKPFRWNHTTQRCDGMKYNLTGENLLGYLHNVTFNGIQNHTVSFNENADTIRSYEINTLQTNESGQYDYVSAGFWDLAYKENAIMLNNTFGIEEVISRCSKPCKEGMIRINIDPDCQLCFKCIPCVGPTYSMNSSETNCSLCDDNHWGNNPLSGSTHCVPVKVQHLDYSNGWSIIAMCIASITLIILTVIIVIFAINWNTPVVKSSGREQMVMLLVGIKICCILTFVIVAPPSTAVCVFQRIDVWFWFSLAFGALLVKIIRVARIFYSIKSQSVKRPSFTKPIYQVIFTVAIVSFQLFLVLIGLIIDHPVVKRDPEVVTTSFGQTGNAPEIIETCVQPHTAILVLSLIYNSALIIGCTILGLRTMGFPENFNEAKHVMFTSFTLINVWVLFIPVYSYTEEEFRSGVLALGIILSAVAVMAGIFFPRVFIIVFQKHKNTPEYLSNHTIGTTQSTNFSVAFKRNLSRDTFVRPGDISMSKDDKSQDKGNLTSNSGVITRDDTVKDCQSFPQPESIDSSLL